MGVIPWWQSSIIYHMVVPSFFDSDDDGFGDLAGVIARLDPRIRDAFRGS